MQSVLAHQKAGAVHNHIVRTLELVTELYVPNRLLY